MSWCSPLHSVRNENPMMNQQNLTTLSYLECFNFVTIPYMANQMTTKTRTATPPISKYPGIYSKKSVDVLVVLVVRPEGHAKHDKTIQYETRYDVHTEAERPVLNKSCILNSAAEGA